ncbi:MAG: hypothetical protein LBQ33_04840 [Oscillospiraceae bacterium]|jgi:hypothetical protein|nr:hypothetical protein [Oscillospiraceae bacterium]
MQKFKVIPSESVQMFFTYMYQQLGGDEEAYRAVSEPAEALRTHLADDPYSHTARAARGANPDERFAILDTFPAHVIRRGFAQYAQEYLCVYFVVDQARGEVVLIGIRYLDSAQVKELLLNAQYD